MSIFQLKKNVKLWKLFLFFPSIYIIICFVSGGKFGCLIAYVLCHAFFLNDSIFSRYIPDAESAFKVADIYDSTNFDIIIHVQSYVNILGHAGVIMPFVIVCARSSYVVGCKNNITFITFSKLRSHLLPNKIWSFVRIRNIKKRLWNFIPYHPRPTWPMYNMQKCNI